MNRRYCKSKSKSIVKRVRKLERKVARNKSELKYVYDTVLPASYAAGITHFTIGGIQQGTSEGERIGESVRLLNVTGCLSLSNAGSSNEVHCRVMVTRDKISDQDSTITLSEMLELPSTGDSNENQVTAMYNKSYKTKYQILYDKRMYLGQIGDSTNQYYFKWSKRLNFIQRYSGSGGSSTDMIDNKLYVTVILTDGVRGNLNTRVTFVDP